MKFVKMHGLGNDFVVIDRIRQSAELTTDQIRKLGDRNFGIGFDQLLVVEKPGHSGVDFSYRIFNKDGREVAQCGNGARCFARFVRDEGLCEKPTIRVATLNGELTLEHLDDGNVCVDMGIPKHAPEAIPINVNHEDLTYDVDMDGVTWSFGAVSIGNPHAVLTVAEVEQAPVGVLGPKLESHPVFPERANIGFMQIVHRHAIRLRVYERGVGETLACGSGACAAVVVGILQGQLASPVQVNLPGGELTINWEGKGRPVIMIGSATRVFEGVIEL